MFAYFTQKFKNHALNFRALDEKPKLLEISRKFSKNF